MCSRARAQNSLPRIHLNGTKFQMTFYEAFWNANTFYSLVSVPLESVGKISATAGSWLESRRKSEKPHWLGKLCRRGKKTQPQPPFQRPPDFFPLFLSFCVQIFSQGASRSPSLVLFSVCVASPSTPASVFIFISTLSIQVHAKSIAGVVFMT